MRLKMCSIHVKDPATAHAFYTGTLGFDTLMAMPEYNLFIIKNPGADDTATGLLLEPSDNPIGANYMNAVYDAGMPAVVLGCPTSGPSTSVCWPLAWCSRASLPRIHPVSVQCSTTAAGTSCSCIRTSCTAMAGTLESRPLLGATSCAWFPWELRVWRQRSPGLPWWPLSFASLP